jgi:2-polyprenyl-3-methyl-5-hydroxy-6-metoxy-1,4-benzoquinol methylase
MKGVSSQVRRSSTYRDRIYTNYGHNFQDAGDVFDQKAAERWSRSVAYHLRGWLPHDKNARILDAACGNGKLLFFFLKQGYTHLTGVDISPDQVALARQVIPNVRQESVLDHLEANPDTYDLITGYDIVEHFHKDEAIRFLEGCFHSLRSGGRLILQTPNAESPLCGAVRDGDITHELCFTPILLTRLMRMVEFDSIEVREPGPVPYGNSVISSIRYLLWMVIKAGLGLWNLAETGTIGSGVWTRVFLISGVKKG